MNYYLRYRKLYQDKIENYVCFSSQFKEYFNFDLYIYLGNKFYEENKDHKVILSNKDINLFLRTIKKEFGGIVSVGNDTHYQPTKNIDEAKCKKIRIRFDKCKFTEDMPKETVYKLLCTYTRYLFEKDFSGRLKKAIKAYRKDNSIHLLTYLYNAHKGEFFNSGHSAVSYSINDIASGVKFVPLEKTSFENNRFNEMVTSLYKVHEANHLLTNKEYKQVKNNLKA